MQPKDFVERLSNALLHWDYRFASAVKKDFTEAMLNLVSRERIWNALGPEMSSVASSVWDVMNEPKRRDFVTAPHIVMLIRQPILLQDPYWRNYLLVILMASSGIFEISPTARADLHTEFLFHKYRARPFHSLRLRLDAHAPIPHMEPEGNALSCLDDSNRDLVKEKVNDGLSLIRLISPRAFAWSTSATIAIDCRVDLNGGFASCSFRELPGLSLLCNAHLPKVTIGKISNAIVHESIHSVIYMFESCGSLLVTNKPAPSYRVKSLWTGRTLTLDSFIQACFVWFGLFHFWRNGRQCHDESVGFMEITRAGFSEDRYEEVCENLHPYVSESVVATMKSLSMVRHHAD